MALIDWVRGNKVASVGTKEKLKIKNGRTSLQPVVGHAFGSVFGLTNTGLELKIEDDLDILHLQDTQYRDPALRVDGGNANIVDDNTSQALSVTVIKTLKEGKTAAEMAALLAANSKTFEAKTQYAQEKFLKRKKRTYTNEVVFLEPTARRVAKHLFEKPHARDAIRGKISYTNPENLNFQYM